MISFDDDKELIYKKSDLDQVTLAYCCSIHKSQGSEYPLVILPLVDTYSRMLRKDLLYTAITRAQKSLVMVGNPQSFNLAVTQKQTPRQTFLSDTLRLVLANSIKATERLEQSNPVEESLEITNSESITNETKILEDDVASSELLENQAIENETMIEIELPKKTILTMENIWEIDPMIGMENLSPYDFMK